MNDLTKWTIILNELFWWTNFVTDRTISLKKRFQRTNNFTKQNISLNDLTEEMNLLNERFCYTNEIVERTFIDNYGNRWKMNDESENELVQISTN